MSRVRNTPDKVMKPSDYSYDYDRTVYMRKYYKKRREELAKRAKARYRAIVTAKYTTV